MSWLELAEGLTNVPTNRERTHREPERRLNLNQQLTGRRAFLFVCQLLGAFKTLTILIWMVTT